MPFAFHNQPVKGLYLAYQAFTIILFRLPYWILVSLPRSWRPRESWTLYKTISIRLLRRLMIIADQTGHPPEVADYRALKSDTGVNGVWIAPVDHLVRGELKRWSEISNVSSIRIPGYWLHKEGSEMAVAHKPLLGEKVVYMLHGGAYIRMSAHPADPTANIPKGLLRYTDSVSRVFSVEYRLASGKPFKEAHPFPTQLIDALAGYNYLINVVGFKPKNIIIAGDSAGGNLAHALTQYLVDNQHLQSAGIPKLPGALLLFSPWVDLSDSYLNQPYNKNGVSDYVPGTGGLYPQMAFLGPHGPSAAETNPYISPACLLPSMRVNFKEFPRTFITAGGAEILLESIKVYRDRMVKDLGEGDGILKDDGKVRYFEMPDAVHDFLVFDWLEPRALALQEINRWINAS